MPNLPCQTQSHITRVDRPTGRPHSKLLPLFAAMLLVAAALTMANAQEESAQTLAERSAIVVRGTVLKVNASDEPMVAASRSTAVISVVQMYAGNEIAGELKGRTATVILSRPDSVKAGEEVLFFGNPRFLGRSLTIADEGELPVKTGAPTMMSELAGGAQARKDKPVRDRIATADLVFRGTVDSVSPLGTETEEAKKTAPPGSEHDPEWQVANVRIAAALRGGEAGKFVTIIFPASRDIVWFNAPKLKVGQDAVFLCHAPNKQDTTLSRSHALAALQEKQPVYFVTDPFDVLAPADEDHLRGLLAGSKETKQ
jgi:hypothetical protein